MNTQDDMNSWLRADVMKLAAALSEDQRKELMLFVAFAAEVFGDAQNFPDVEW
jgi:hypothetical protein